MPELMEASSNLNIENQKSQLTFIIKHMYDMFLERDIDFLEVNPLGITYDDKLIASHAKIRID